MKEILEMIGAVTLTGALAVWGASVATLVLLWDIYKYKVSGARVTISAKPDMHLSNMPGVSSGTNFISVDVKNNGDRPTTITNFGLKAYRVIIPYLMKKQIFQAVVGNQPLQPLPHRLDPGTVWNGFSNQDLTVKDYPQVNMIVMVVYLSHRKKPISACVWLKKKKRP